MIRGTVSDGILVDLLSLFSAREMWEFALETNSLEDPESQAEIWNEIARMRLEEDPTAQQMEDHMEGFNGLLLKASYAGLNLREAERIDRFLVTLPKSFEVFRMQFRVSNKSGRTWFMVRKEFNREQNARSTRARIEENDRQHASALAVNARKSRQDPSTARCYNCNEIGHFSRDCPKERSHKGRSKGSAKTAQGDEASKEAKAMTMSHWAMAMSESERRSRQVRSWMWDENYGIQTEVDSEGDAVGGTTGSSGIYSTMGHSHGKRWILDSGATHHIVPSESHLVEITPLATSIDFSAASGGQLTSRAKGNMPVKLSCGRQINIEDVHIVPGATVNLLSARQLARKGWTVTISDTAANISQGNDVIELSDVHGLWTTEFDIVHGFAMAITPSPPQNKIMLRDEHDRLGHIGRHKLIKLAYEGKLRISHTDALLDPFRIAECVTCQKMKIARKSKDGTSPHGTKSAELVHIDIAGPMAPSAAGFDHFVAILDDN